MNKRLTDEEMNEFLTAFDSEDVMDLDSPDRIQLSVTEGWTKEEDTTDDLFRTMMKLNGTVEWDYKGDGSES